MTNMRHLHYHTRTAYMLHECLHCRTCTLCMCDVQVLPRTCTAYMYAIYVRRTRTPCMYGRDLVLLWPRPFFVGVMTDMSLFSTCLKQRTCTTYMCDECLHYDRGVARILHWGATEAERRRHEKRGAKGAERSGDWGGGGPSPTD